MLERPDRAPRKERDPNVKRRPHGRCCEYPHAGRALLDSWVAHIPSPELPRARIKRLTNVDASGLVSFLLPVGTHELRAFFGARDAAVRVEVTTSDLDADKLEIRLDPAGVSGRSVRLGPPSCTR